MGVVPFFYIRERVEVASGSVHRFPKVDYSSHQTDILEKTPSLGTLGGKYLQNGSIPEPRERLHKNQTTVLPL
uniref:Uncharacterized protein n=1 Tax=Timema cristinae TaxID=61476 RepID=A0A7R9CN49_TIMCR|nr:unnamed protein product [Timema cristinae]